MKEVAYYYYVKDTKTGTWTDVSCLSEEQQVRLRREAYQKLAEGFGGTGIEKSSHSDVPGQCPQE